MEMAQYVSKLNFCPQARFSSEERQFHLYPLISFMISFDWNIL